MDSYRGLYIAVGWLIGSAVIIPAFYHLLFSRRFKLNGANYRSWFFTSVFSTWLLLLQLIRWELFHGLTPFLLVPIEMLSYSAVVVSIVGVIIEALRKDWKILKCLLVSLPIYCVCMLVNFNGIPIHYQYLSGARQRDTVVEKIRTGELVPNVDYNSNLIKLPSEYQYLSKGGGEVVVDKSEDHLYVLFYTFRGLLGHFNGLLYSSTGKLPNENQIIMSDSTNVLKKYDDHWFLVGECTLSYRGNPLLTNSFTTCLEQTNNSTN